MEYPSSGSVLEKIEKILKKSNKYLITDEIMCACYLYKFLKYKSSKAFERFKYIFCRLSDDGKNKAIRYYMAYAKSNEVQNNKRLIK